MKHKEQLPDFNSSYSHSCNNLASYDIKKNPDPTRKNMTKGDQLNQTANMTASKVKQESKPNLDEGNVYFQQNLDFLAKFQNKHVSTLKKPKQTPSKETVPR